MYFRVNFDSGFKHFCSVPFFRVTLLKNTRQNKLNDFLCQSTYLNRCTIFREYFNSARLHNLLGFTRGTWWYDFNLLNQFWRNHVHTFVSTKTPALGNSSLAWERKTVHFTINYNILPCKEGFLILMHNMKNKIYLHFFNLQSSEIKLTFHLYNKQAAQNSHS